MSRQPFIHLADPSTYVACSWDLSTDPAGREHWVSFFIRHFDTILRQAIESEADGGIPESQSRPRAESAKRELTAKLEAYAKAPTAFGRVTILVLDEWRDQVLRSHGFVDAFRVLKRRENDKMLPLLPQVCRQIDDLQPDPSAQLRAVIEGVFAGNIFDMGAEATAKAFLGASPDFFATRSKLKPRPWLIDDYDRLAARLLGEGGYRRCVFLIDNAGSDFLLGALPMMRWLAQRGTEVVLAANERPTLNDMTIHDVNGLWPTIVAAEPSLAHLPIQRVSTGTGEPLIDMSAVSPELNDAAVGADLLVFEGMGRGVETNLDCEFAIDTLNLAMLKDHVIAARCGGELYDCVCRFREFGSARSR